MNKIVSYVSSYIPKYIYIYNPSYTYRVKRDQSESQGPQAPLDCKGSPDPKECLARKGTGGAEGFQDP